MRKHIHTYTHIYTYTHTHIHTYTHAHIHTYTHTHTHTHTYIYACAHKYIHTHTHTQTYTFSKHNKRQDLSDPLQVGFHLLPCTHCRQMSRMVASGVQNLAIQRDYIDTAKNMFSTSWGGVRELYDNTVCPGSERNYPLTGKCAPWLALSQCALVWKGTTP